MSAGRSRKESSPHPGGCQGFRPDGRRSGPIGGRSTFGSLVRSIRRAHEQLAAQAGRAINTCLTIRNWVIGFYISEYEQHGSDRAEYGGNLLVRLAARLQREGMSRVEERELRRFRQFYITYPSIRESLAPELRALLPAAGASGHRIREPVAPGTPGIDGRTLLARLSFTHLSELIEIDDALKRAFYEIECIRGNLPKKRGLQRFIAEQMRASAGPAGGREAR